MIYVVKNRETISDVSTEDGVGFTSTYIPPTDVNVIYATVQAIDGPIRICMDGTAPTSTKGIRIIKDTIFEVWGGDALAAFRAIDDGGSAKLEVIYMGRG